MTDTYNANDIQKLEYPYSVIRRPSMYLGERGTQQTVASREIIDNAIHECIRGYANRVKVTFGSDKSVTVQDNGRGLPTDINKSNGLNGIILTMATLHAGANFATKVGVGKAGAGINGVGSSACNAMSKRYDAIVYKENKRFMLSFQDGIAGHFAGDTPEDKFTRGDDIVVTKDTRSAAEKKMFKTGTVIKFWFNEERFPDDEHVNIDDLVNRLEYTAFIVPHIDIEIIDENRTYEDGSFYSWSIRSEHGLPEMIEVMSKAPMLPNTDSKKDMFTEKGIYQVSTQGVYKEVVNDEITHKSSEVDRVVTADLAFQYNTGYEKKLFSFVNTIHTHLGGVHEQALEKAIMNSFGERMGSMRGILSAKDEPPIIDDFFEGMTVALSINVPEPQFVGQQKDKLSGPEVKKALTEALTTALNSFVNAPANQKFLKPMFEKVAQASKNRQAAAQAKIAKRKSSQLSSASMPTKLSDCDFTGTEEAELLICEGDSAKGTIVQARDASYQAVLPIRGKIINVLKNDRLSQIMANKEIEDITKALGAGIGKSFDVEKIRYGKVLFAADADFDGFQINNLLYTVFARLFRPMIEEGRVYQTVPPLFEIKVGSGKNEKKIYCIDDAEMISVTKKLDKEGKKYSVERSKGLGAMSKESFSETVLNPETRTLRRITIDDAEKAEEMLILTMGKDAAPRKVFMSDNFQVAIDSGLVEGYEAGIE